MTELRPEDLRINSWYHSVKWDKPVQLTAEDIYNLVANADGANISSYISDMFTPIPLSEDWLKRFGFEKDNETYSWGILITLDKCDFMFEIEVFANEPGFYYRDRCHEIKTVHHLMNLYHSLTGAELKAGK